MVADQHLCQSPANHACILNLGALQRQLNQASTRFLIALMTIVHLQHAHDHIFVAQKQQQTCGCNTSNADPNSNEVAIKVRQV